jgi:replicative DNA helicase
MTSQFQVLNKILKTKDFSIVTLNNLNSSYFYNYVNEFNFIKNHYEKYHQVPDEVTFLEAFPDFDIVDVSEPDSYLLEQLYNDYNTSYLATRFNKIKSMIESGKTDDAVAYFMESANNLHQGTAMTCTDLFADTSRYDHYLDRLANKSNYYLSTGFPELDKIIGGIDLENENMVIAARTGQGKSFTLFKMAAAAALQGKVVGIYSGEMTADKVGYRIDTILSHINNNAITRGNDFDQSVKYKYKDYIDNIKNICKGTIKVLTPADISGPATVPALRAFIEKEKLDILFIDQYSLLEDTSHAKAPFERVANISKAIKNLQVMSKIPIISVSQMNRTKNEDGEQDTTQIGLSDRIGQDATCILMLSRDISYADEDKTKVLDDKLIINIVKSRDGGNGKLIYKVDFNTGNFFYLNPDYTEQEAEAEAASFTAQDGIAF